MRFFVSLVICKGAKLFLKVCLDARIFSSIKFNNAKNLGFRIQLSLSKTNFLALKVWILKKFLRLCELPVKVGFN
jgi:hypothetical protein